VLRRPVALLLLPLALARAPVALSAAEPAPPEAPPADEAAPEASGEPSAPPPETPVDPFAPLDGAERATLLRLAWNTLVGHLTGRPIRDDDLLAYDLTPRLLAPRGLWVTVRKVGTVRGSQGEIEPSRPLYQQVIVFVRRAATRDPRFLPLTELDLEATALEIAIVGKREAVEGPGAIETGRHGVFLEKWGRRAMFLPGIAAAQGWSAERTLQELCRSASLPQDAWTAGARVEVFTVETVAGPRPAADPPAGAPADPPTPGPAPEGPAGDGGDQRRRS
jgi:AmmeMemoRadiSam system protein A